MKDLTDAQLALIIKAALDYNAFVISHASFIYGQDMKPNVRKTMRNNLVQLSKDYTKTIKSILEDDN